MLLDCCQVPDQHHSGIFEKYNDKRFKYCSDYVQDEIKTGFELPGHQPTIFTMIQQAGSSCDGASPTAAEYQYQYPFPQASEA